MAEEVKWKYGKPGLIVLMCLCMVFIIVTFAFNYLAGHVITPNLDVYQNGIKNTWMLYELDVTPENWIFVIWPVIYVLLIIMLIYIFTLTCRTSKESKEKLYHDPPFIPVSFYALFMLSCVLNVTWLFVFDGEYLVGSMVTLLALALTLGIILFFAIWLLYRYKEQLGRSEMWLNIVLVHNVLAMYVTWVVLVAILHVGIVIHYQGDHSMAAACWAVLITILVMACAYFVLDISQFTMTFRYIVTPYVVVLLTVGAIVDKNLDWDQEYQLLAVAILVLIGIFFVAKIIISVVRAINQPSALESDTKYV